MCMLDCLDENNGMEYYNFYYGNGNNSWFQGVNDDRTNKPAHFSKDGVLMELPAVVALLPYFRNVVDEFYLKLK